MVWLLLFLGSWPTTNVFGCGRPLIGYRLVDHKCSICGFGFGSDIRFWVRFLVFDFLVDEKTRGHEDVENNICY
jgi:hypothetical protein